jgi:valyl-tRNA synthetase
MIMLSLYTTGQIPFKDVYLHGMVLDEHSQKMSKSKGNVINPMDSIAEYGSDALRLGLIANRSPGQHQAFSTDRIIAGRNFCNKLWNIARFAEHKFGENYQPGTPEPRSLADHWIVSELTTATQQIEKAIDKYRLSEASESLYHVVWDSVADWYIEASKDQDNLDLLAWVLDTSLKLAHPFAPFVTETIWQTLPWHNDLLINAEWPQMIEFNDMSAAEFTRVQELVNEARFVISSLPGNEKYTLLSMNDSLVEDNKDLIKRLAKLKDVAPTDVAKGLRLANSGRDAWLDVSAETLAEHQTNLEARLATAHADIKALQSRLANKNYVEKAPTILVQETYKQLEEKEALVTRLQTELEILT